MNRHHKQTGLDFGLVLRGIMLVLIAAWLSGCSGSDREPAVVLPFPPGDTGVPPGDDRSPGDDETIVGTAFECPAEDGSAVDALAACGGPNVICVGYFDGTSVGNLAPLTTGSRPAWSPDGLRIAFHRPPQPGANRHLEDIYLINADGSGEQLLTAGRDPSWSPDGQRIIFGGAEGVAVINADGTGRTTLLRHDTWDAGFAWPAADFVSHPDWSPDGQRIALVHYSGLWNSATIVLINADGSDSSYVVSGGWPDHPVWSPTGGEIAWHTLSGLFPSFDPGGSIWTDSDERRLLVNHIAEVSRSAWSPNGSALAYTSNPHCGPRPAIRIVDRQGESTRTLVRNAREPTWSPDGAKLAFRTGSFANLLPPDFPPVPEGAEIYMREHPDSMGSLSRYVLYSDAGFELQYVTDRWGSFAYKGRYTRDGPGLTFDFDASSVAGPWQATGTLDGDRLTIRYNLIMIMSDFEDGVYVLSGG
jgi:dipeptidyl aminopeptidase/acylaminoacyl peptidase